MTPAELEALARRAVACKHWRWIEGMLTERGDRIASVEHDSLIVLDEEFEIVELTDGKAIPDLRDPATVGCLLALVREAWGHNAPFSWWPRASTTWWPQDGDSAEYWSIEFKDYYQGATEAEALVAALEGAP